MSLKIFHIFFISVSAILATALVYWGFEAYLKTGEKGRLGLGIVGVFMLAALVPYLGWFWKKMNKIVPLVIVAVGGSWLFGHEALACAICFGDPTSPLSHAARMGVISLGVVVGLVLMGIVAVAVSWIRRARMKS